jgi:hypothetical protein
VVGIRGRVIGDTTLLFDAGKFEATSDDVGSVGTIRMPPSEQDFDSACSQGHWPGRPKQENALTYNERASTR